MKETIGFGVVGCGVIAPLHINGIKKTAGTRLVAVCDESQEKAEKLGKEKDVPYYTKLGEMLNRDDLDVVCICTPSFLHPEQTIMSAKAGKHVITEKPMATTLDKADKMIEECKKWGIPEPDFEDTGTAIVVIFKKFSFTPEILKTLKLNERQIKTLEFIKEHNRISTKEYCNLFNVARDTANRDLNDLLEKGIIERQGHGPRTYYILSAVSIGQYRTVSDSNSGKKEKTQEIG